MTCFPVNMPVTGAVQAAFLALVMLLATAMALHRIVGSRPRVGLRVLACSGCLVACASMLWAVDEGATDHDLWQWVIAPLGLTVFAVYAELVRARVQPLAIALRPGARSVRPGTQRREARAPRTR